MNLVASTSEEYNDKGNSIAKPSSSPISLERIAASLRLLAKNSSLPSKPSVFSNPLKIRQYSLRVMSLNVVGTSYSLLFIVPYFWFACNFACRFNSFACRTLCQYRVRFVFALYIALYITL